jgi:hypothetical protein
VHIRYLLGSVQDWTEFFKQAYTVLKPGGWLESYEASVRVYSDDGTMPPTSALAQWSSLFLDSGKKIGRSFDIVEENEQNRAMKEAGFVDIQEKWIKVRRSPSPRVMLSRGSKQFCGTTYLYGASDWAAADTRRRVAGRQEAEGDRHVRRLRRRPRHRGLHHVRVHGAGLDEGAGASLRGASPAGAPVAEASCLVLAEGGLGTQA